MTVWLLDTNAISDVMRNPFGAVARKIDTLSTGDSLCTSIVVACELRYGTAKRGSASMDERVEIALEDIPAQPLEEDADRHYARLRADLERRGTPIGRNDMLIAAHALALDATLVTANTSEFERIEGLKLENWLR